MTPEEALEVIDINIERGILNVYGKETVAKFDEAMKVLRKLVEKTNNNK